MRACKVSAEIGARSLSLSLSLSGGKCKSANALLGSGKQFDGALNCHWDEEHSEHGEPPPKEKQVGEIEFSDTCL